MATEKEIAQLVITLKAQTKDIKKGLDDAKSQVKSFASTFKTALAGIGVYLGIRELVRGVRSIVDFAIGYNSEIEQQKLGIASLVSATSKIVDNTGKVLEGHEKLNAALTIADKLYEQIRVKALSTSATTPEIVQGFQSMIAPGRAAGLTYEQILDVAIRIVQAMQAMRLPMIQMRVEANALLKGEENIRADVMKNLGIRGAILKQMKAQGKLYDFLMEKLAPMAIAGEKQLETYEGMKTSLKDILSILGSMALKPIFTEAVKSLRALTYSLVEFKRDAKGAITEMKIKPEIQKAIKDISTAVTSLIKWIERAVKGFLWFWDVAGKPTMYLTIATGIGLITTRLITLLKTVRSLRLALLGLGRAAIIGGLVELGIWGAGVVSNFKEAGDMAERLRERLKGVANISELGANFIIQLQKRTKDLALSEEEIVEAFRRGIIKITKVTQGKLNVFWKLEIDKDALAKMRKDLDMATDDFQTDFGDLGNTIDEEMKKKITEAIDAITGKIKEYKAEMISLVSPLAGARAELEKMVWEKTKDVKLTPELTAKIKELREQFEKLADAKIEKELTDKLQELNLELVKLESPIEEDRIAFEKWLDELTRFKDTVPAISILIDELRTKFEKLQEARKQQKDLEIIKQGYESRKTLEENLTNVTGTELNKRLSNVDTWIREQNRLAEEEARAELRATGDKEKAYELFEKRKTDILEAAEVQRSDIRRQYGREVIELELERQLAIIDRMEAARLITETEAVNKRVLLQKQYLKYLYEDYKTVVNVTGKELERLELLEKIALKEAEITGSLKRQEELTGTMFEGMKAGWHDFVSSLKTEWEYGYAIIQDGLSSLKDSLAELFGDARKGEIKEWYEYFKKVSDAVLARLEEYAAQMILFGETGTGGLLGALGLSKLFGLGKEKATRPLSPDDLPLPVTITEGLGLEGLDLDLDEDIECIEKAFSEAGDEEEGRQTSFLGSLWEKFKGLLSGIGSIFLDLISSLGDVFSKLLSGLGSLLSSIFKGITGALGFQTGGEIRGASGVDKVNIKATSGEFIHPVDSVKYYGIQVMEAIRQKLIPKELFQGISAYFKPVPLLSFVTGGIIPNITQSTGNSFGFDIDIDARNMMMKAYMEDRMKKVAIETIQEFF